MPDAKMNKSETQMPIDILILAAGTGSRFDKDTPKQFVKINGLSLLHHACTSVAGWPACNSLTICYPEAGLSPQQTAELDSLAELIGRPIHRVAGGSRRDISVHHGLQHIFATSGATSRLVMIHDCARPFVPHAVLDRLLDAYHAQDKSGYLGIIPVMPVTDTIKAVDQSPEAGINTVSHTMDRNALVRVQTPQLFQLSDILQLHNDFAARQPADTTALPTDDASLMEQAGGLILTVEGASLLEKITYRDDLARLSAEAGFYQKGQDMPIFIPRVATGYDVHKFSKTEPGPVMICGVAVPHAVNVTAHSDGDVGLHALCDAIFGALADGDIGSHFPPSDERWRDATSDQFLAFACNRAHAVGAQISNLDVTLICEQPKITPHRDAMRTRIAEICALPVSHISVKATTSEGLGFTGRREGIAAQATATLLLPVIQEGSSKS